MTRARPLVIVGIVVILLVAAVVAAAYVTRERWDAPEPRAEEAPAGLERFYSQTVAWKDCGRGRCGTVRVPVDYADPSGGTTTLAVKVYPSRSGTAKRSLFVNPGGPGGSAIEFARTLSVRLDPAVRAAYDVVGVDPRGVGESAPLDCLDDDDLTAYTRLDPDPDSEEEVAVYERSIQAFGEGCRARAGALASHVSTQEAARDMDVVRALLGRAELDWFGASYGTQLGATYAQLFPDKVGRMVLDGAVDPSQSAVEGAFAQAVGFQRALEAYAVDCVAKDDCPLGNDAEEGIARIRRLLDELDRKPIPAGDGRTLSESEGLTGVAVAMYERLAWPLLSEALEAAFDGDGEPLMGLADLYLERDSDGKYSGNLHEVFTAITCMDEDSPGTRADVQAQLPRFEKASPVFGPGLAWGIMLCDRWPLEATTPQVPITGAGAPPIVILGTTRDPATPYESAQALQKQLANSVLVTRDGDGHTAYLSGNDCISKAVDDFLADGTVPEDGLVCD